jgi:ribosomal protein S14
MSGPLAFFETPMPQGTRALSGTHGASIRRVRQFGGASMGHSTALLRKRSKGETTVRCGNCDGPMSALSDYTLCFDCRRLRHGGELVGFVIGVVLTLVACAAVVILIWPRQ